MPVEDFDDTNIIRFLPCKSKKEVFELKMKIENDKNSFNALVSNKTLNINFFCIHLMSRVHKMSSVC